MKQIHFIALSILLFCSQIGFSQTIPEGARGIKEGDKIPEGAVMLNENTTIRDVEGNKVDFFKFIEMMDSGEWSSEPVLDEEGTLQYVQIKKQLEKKK